MARRFGMIFLYFNNRLPLKTLIILICCICAFGTPYVSMSQTNSGQSKIALIIGAQNYTSLPPLRNAIRDAEDMTRTLSAKGFEVETLYDPKTKKEIRDAVTRYFNVMRHSTGAVGILFYAGHGTQFDGMNYIIPTSAPLDNPGDLEEYCVKMNYVMDVLKAATNSLNIVILDACRSIPSFTRDSGQGLTRMEAPQGAIVIFATQPGKVASDGVGTNGLFTSKFLKAINEPGLNISDLLKKVKQDVYAESKQQQLPSVEDNSIGGDFYFTGHPAQGVDSSKPEPTMPSAAAGSALPGPETTSSIKSPGISSKAGAVESTDFGYGPGSYKEVRIGNQEWVQANLNASTFADGTSIPHAKSIDDWKRAGSTRTPAWCFFENDAGYGKEHGKLYNWYAVADPRGLCPIGYHVPSEREWILLIERLGSEPGKKIKLEGAWSDKSKGGDVDGFGAVPSGSRDSEGLFNELEVRAKWWSATEYDDAVAWGRSIKDGYLNVYKDKYPKTQGFSVRCLKDVP